MRFGAWLTAIKAHVKKLDLIYGFLLFGSAVKMKLRMLWYGREQTQFDTYFDRLQSLIT